MLEVFLNMVCNEFQSCTVYEHQTPQFNIHCPPLVNFLIQKMIPKCVCVWGVGGWGGAEGEYVTGELHGINMFTTMHIHIIDYS